MNALSPLYVFLRAEGGRLPALEDWGRMGAVLVKMQMSRPCADLADSAPQRRQLHF